MPATRTLDTVYKNSIREETLAKALRIDRIYLYGFMIFVVLLSLIFFANQSLRLDESQSLWQSAHNIPGIMQVVAEDVHVPLYHILLHFWQLLWGTNVAVARF